MYGYPNMFNSQNSIDKINAQMAELDRMKQQLQQSLQPAINQTFQLAPQNSPLKIVDKRECHSSITVGEFAEENNQGTYLVTMPNHITVVIDGTIYDTFDCSDRIMRCAWKVKVDK